MLQRFVSELLGVHGGLLALLYFGSVPIVLTAGPKIETCIFDSVF